MRDEERNRRPSIITVEFVREVMMKNLRFTITELISHFPQILRSSNALASQWISLQDKIQADIVDVESDVHDVLGQTGQSPRGLPGKK